LSQIKPLIEKQIAAFTVAELGEMLPVEIERKDRKRFHAYIAKERGDFSDEVRYFVEYQERNKGEENYEIEVQRCAGTEADARAKMLIYLLENRLIITA
jgi:hypothetical protein